MTDSIVREPTRFCFSKKNCGGELLRSTLIVLPHGVYRNSESQQEQVWHSGKDQGSLFAAADVHFK